MIRRARPVALLLAATMLDAGCGSASRPGRRPAWPGRAA